jgi:hypothetical protein
VHRQNRDPIVPTWLLMASTALPVVHGPAAASSPTRTPRASGRRLVHPDGEDLPEPGSARVGHLDGLARLAPQPDPVEVPEISRATQACTVAEIETMARDLIGIMLEAEPDSFAVDVQIELPAGVRSHLAAAERARAEEVAARSHAAAELRAAAVELKSYGTSVRDLGKLLGVSFQRASQLTSGNRATTTGPPPTAA